MKLQQWTLFVDMLGYREINGEISNDKDASDFIIFMESNSNTFDVMNGAGVKETYRDNKEFDLYKYYEVSACFVSDSMIMTFKPIDVDDLINEDLAMMHSANTLFIIAMRLQGLIFSCFFQKGIFLRGGISNKYSLIRGNFAVGEGVIEAYKAESEIAKYPRIVLHPTVQANQALMGKVDYLAQNMYGGHGILQHDAGDGLLFIDYLGYAAATIDTSIPMILGYATRFPEKFESSRKQTHDFFRHHSTALKAKIIEMEGKVQAATTEQEKEKAIRLKQKFDWLKDYHNRVIGKHQELEPYLFS